ncbi:MAG: circularly permuted type 2 ATP-grasp protein [Candidatus Thiodiazotropha taylori]|nr:circularly permuted type 2 ATP-grasp protein [Candidatus Thiodiazotropha taylori]MCG8028731.1 circularly permuted type 2 ATP-grasp protein [Candidatus Thiodiazotropha taylori]MCG8108731.1 circularly permuted type 2 ATP-grasp protein [Candidatus Thiodiazotropha taylori]MCG8112308.1 circularly permuted type 2 ATP-grasp protein [Candidatus Thiodiazotropha taylori]MCW4281067.1 circularly permuted type 2 ATP-grasp protein [Candidatus Thiodiazotropha taylori]
MTINRESFENQPFFDELITPNGHARGYARKLISYLGKLDEGELASRQLGAELALKQMGITFRVYTEEEGSIDRVWPFDIVPRLIPKKEWERIESGLKQRVEALNLFIDDLYHKQQIVKDKVFPAEVLADSENFREQCIGINPPLGVWAHICGSDLVRDDKGEMYVLEDNLRVPSGVSYMLENRLVTKRVFPELFETYSPLPIDDYPSELFDTLSALSPRPGDHPEIAVLTPGIYNSAYYEHAYLAQQMGCELVEGRDLVVEKDDCVYMRNIEGLSRVDVIYRRIDDLFLDPEAFNADSMLGVPGLMRAWKAGNVALANSPGAGVADDKVVYSYVPDIIRYYLDQEPIVPNVPTWRCMDKQSCDYVLEHLKELVVKPANESGGYGLLVGPASTKQERETFQKLIKKNPRNYIAQPTLAISTVPTISNGLLEPRHVDLRPFILSGKSMEVTTGGLTRVALRKGSLVVNSSQGGGSKDTWIIDS